MGDLIFKSWHFPIKITKLNGEKMKNIIATLMVVGALAVGGIVGRATVSEKEQPTQREEISRVSDLDGDGYPDEIQDISISYGGRDRFCYRKGYNPYCLPQQAIIEYLEPNEFYKKAAFRLMTNKK